MKQVGSTKYYLVKCDFFYSKRFAGTLSVKGTIPIARKTPIMNPNPTAILLLPVAGILISEKGNSFSSVMKISSVL